MNPRRSLRRTAAALAGVLATALAVTSMGLVSPAQAANRVTPGNFTGYGFDQCVAPKQSAMDAWLTSSPFWAVSIYISGDSRACPVQPNLSPTWISTQLAAGWTLLPITLGPQASCTTRERYLQQVRINPRPKNGYGHARKQGRDEADKTIRASQALGIAKGSTHWYDIEAFDIAGTDCRESALNFLSAWTNRLHSLGYVSGVYSSAASGVKMLDDAMTNRPGTYSMPDQVWIADWNGKDDVYSSYVRNNSWMPHKRVHQYRGGHDERWGGVTINIDSNFLDLGKGSTAPKTPGMCGARSDFTDFTMVRPGSGSATVPLAQCLLKRKGFYNGPVDGVYGDQMARAVNAYRTAHGLGSTGNISRRTWVAILSEGKTPLMKFGSASNSVRRLQRALNATSSTERLAVSGVFSRTTIAAVKRYQSEHHLATSGVVLPTMWRLLQNGAR